MSDDAALVVAQAAALVAGESDAIANAANLSALVYASLPDLNWAGFYFVRGDELVLGPFQGRPACTRIARGRGVCGTAWERAATVVVPDVHAFAGHIACDAASRSEVVVPLVAGGRVIGVLDVDSPRPSRFDAEAVALVERVARLYETSLAAFETAGRPAASKSAAVLQDGAELRVLRHARGDTSMDLSTSYPRSVREKIAGVVMLARTTDKARAQAHGNIGEYHYNCPMDKAVFGFLGLDAEGFLAAVTSAGNDDGPVEAYVKPFVAAKSPDEVEGFNTNFLQYAPEKGSEGEQYFLQLRASVAPDRTDVTSWADVLDLDEGRDVPRRTAAVS